jgi:hypothetical protein
MTDETSLSDRQMQVELDKQRRAAARLLDSLAARLGKLASQGSRVAVGAQGAAQEAGGSIRRMADRLERTIRRRPAASVLAGVLAGVAAAWIYDRVRTRRGL